MIVLILPALAVLAGAGQASATTTWQPAVNEDFPDPSVLDADGVYYAYSTEVGFDDVPYVTSTNGTQWSSAMGDALPTLPSWASFGDTWGPTVARSADGQYVMFYAALDTSSGAECIGEAQSASPAGPFVDQNGAPVVCDPAEGGDIDPYIFADATTGQSYLIWKVNGNSIGQPSSLWAATLSPDLTLTGMPSQLLTDDQFWQADNIEGPAMVAEDGVYYLFYSANNYQGAAYAIGYATCRVTARAVCRQPEQSDDGQRGRHGGTRWACPLLRTTRTGDGLLGVGRYDRVPRRGVQGHVPGVRLVRGRNAPPRPGASGRERVELLGVRWGGRRARLQRSFLRLGALVARFASGRRRRHPGRWWLLDHDGRWQRRRLWRRPVYRRRGRSAPQRADRGHGRHPRRQRLLAGGGGRGNLHLRRRSL